MTEASLTAAFLREMRGRLPGAVIFKHADYMTSGIPDVSITLCGRTTWLEMKYADPKFTSNGLQELTMLRLSAAGNAKYVIWEEKDDARRTMIVSPRKFAALEPEAFCVGFNHQWLVEQIRKAHGL